MFLAFKLMLALCLGMSIFLPWLGRNLFNLGYLTNKEASANKARLVSYLFIYLAFVVLVA